jgi:hypothetical protein
VVTFRMMIGKHLRPIVGKGARKGRLKLLRGQRIETGHAGGKIDEARLIGLAHEVDEATGSAEGAGFSHAGKDNQTVRL